MKKFLTVAACILAIYGSSHFISDTTSATSESSEPSVLYYEAIIERDLKDNSFDYIAYYDDRIEDKVRFYKEKGKQAWDKTRTLERRKDSSQYNKELEKVEEELSEAYIAEANAARACEKMVETGNVEAYAEKQRYYVKERNTHLHAAKYMLETIKKEECKNKEKL